MTGVQFHDLRHTFASRALELGADIMTVSRILGHSSHHDDCEVPSSDWREYASAVGRVAEYLDEAEHGARSSVAPTAYSQKQEFFKTELERQLISTNIYWIAVGLVSVLGGLYFIGRSSCMKHLIIANFIGKPIKYGIMRSASSSEAEEALIILEFRWKQISSGRKISLIDLVLVLFFLTSVMGLLPYMLTNLTKGIADLLKKRL